MANARGRGFLYPVKDRKPEQPNVTGKATLPDGTRIKLAGWTEKARSGVKYISLKVEPDDDNPEGGNAND